MLTTFKSDKGHHEVNFVKAPWQILHCAQLRGFHSKELPALGNKLRWLRHNHCHPIVPGYIQLELVSTAVRLASHFRSAQFVQVALCRVGWTEDGKRKQITRSHNETMIHKQLGTREHESRQTEQTPRHVRGSRMTLEHVNAANGNERNGAFRGTMLQNRWRKCSGKYAAAKISFPPQMKGDAAAYIQTETTAVRLRA